MKWVMCSKKGEEKREEKRQIGMKII